MTYVKIINKSSLYLSGDSLAVHIINTINNNLQNSKIGQEGTRKNGEA